MVVVVSHGRLHTWRIYLPSKVVIGRKQDLHDAFVAEFRPKTNTKLLGFVDLLFKAFCSQFSNELPEDFGALHQ